jgi:hypothetical protein
MSEPSNTRDQDARAARTFSAVTFGDGQPLVPAEVRSSGAGAVVAAVLSKLASLRRERGRLLYRSTPGTPPRKAPHHEQHARR